MKPCVDPFVRFCSKLNLGDSDGCWNWEGSTSKGYGRFFDGSRGVTTHRWLYERLVGPIPADHELDHLCRNKACAKPSHLEAVPHRVNVMRGDAPKVCGQYNRDKDHCRKGHALTPENIIKRNRPGRDCLTCHRERERNKR